MAAYVRVSIFGTLANDEQWSINPVFDPSGEFPGGVNQTNLDAATLAIANRSLPTALRTAMSTAVTRTGARLEVREQADDSLIGISQQGSTTGQNGTTTSYLPPQTCMVLSVRTNTPGPSGRGRLYWPAMGLTLNNQGRITSPTTATFVADFKAYLLGIRTDLATAFPLIGFDLAVRSKTTLQTPHAVRIQAGTVPDVQRRRRDKMQEVYAGVEFP